MFIWLSKNFYSNSKQRIKIKVDQMRKVVVVFSLLITATANAAIVTIDFEGVVSWVASEAEFTPKIIQTKEERVNLVYAVKVLVENDGSLKIGMPGEIWFN